ncbi:MAG: cell division protein FtsZ, partial [Alistipes sp.]|nr:cell division protein FtsZ [Alistipes sp.]
MSENLENEVAVPREDESSIITVVGVGGAGGNAVNHMHELGIKGVTFMACNTDRQALDTLDIDIKIQLGPGLGAGNDPKKGRELAVKSLDDVRRQLQALGTKMLFIAASMGGGTGTGASPVIAELAREMDMLTVAIVTLPWASEGMNRYEQACRGIEDLRKWVDSLLVINNDNISKLYGRLSLKQAFGKADDVLAMAAKGIAEIITLKSYPVNVDFADVQKVMSRSGHAHMAVATATGEDRAIEAAEASLKSPLLDNNSITGASNILLQISVANPDMLMYDEVTRILDCIQAYASTRDEHGKLHTANIIWGSSTKPS